jgi:hypothetical protein
MPSKIPKFIPFLKPFPATGGGDFNVAANRGKGRDPRSFLVFEKEPVLSIG